MQETKYCARHPEIESHLSCTRCDDPVCTRCMVQAPVGVRCPRCARSTRLPAFELSTIYLARAVGAGLAAGIAGGVAFAFVHHFVLYRIPFLELIAIVGVGYFIAEVISASVSRKRGRKLKTVAAGSMLIAYSIISISGEANLQLFWMLASAMAFWTAINRF